MVRSASHRRLMFCAIGIRIRLALRVEHAGWRAKFCGTCSNVENGARPGEGRYLDQVSTERDRNRAIQSVRLGNSRETAKTKLKSGCISVVEPARLKVRCSRNLETDITRLCPMIDTPRE